MKKLKEAGINLDLSKLVSKFLCIFEDIWIIESFSRFHAPILFFISIKIFPNLIYKTEEPKTQNIDTNKKKKTAAAAPPPKPAPPKQTPTLKTATVQKRKSAPAPALQSKPVHKKTKK